MEKTENNIQFSPEVEKIVSLIILSAEKKVLKKAVLSKSIDKNVKKTVITPRKIAGADVLQAETFTADNKARHTNIPLKEAQSLAEICSGYAQINVITTVGESEYRRSKGGKETVIGAGKLSAERLDGAEEAAATGNDKEKNYILKGNEPFLILLGVSDENGRIHDKKRPKFRQINRFLEHIRDVEKHLPDVGTLRICDLCCGKSYLSFAVYHYFANIRGRDVRMTGVDLKADVTEYCASVAKKLGFSGLEFVCGDINAYETDMPPALVISLHACDTATDIVLEKAAKWRTPVILSTPCCHHELNHKLNCTALSFISEYSMLRQKFCDAATDALRLKRLEADGYDCAALELIDPEDTPKNILLRAVLKRNAGAQARERAMLEYLAAKRFLLGK